ncbi:hypothetical protein [Brevundimonas sp.]|uniref:hypothetical protein n=1 Tax=Brevundimonas sp. TaxID=1871086 RepID=UPI002ABBD979|nr:hypothetical protein [Brevundimonas sp.]MDZ4363549.1 hypothetical protein [Brevundimonas sp.]
MKPPEAVTRLYETLERRETPETVLALIQKALPEMASKDWRERIRQILGLSTQARFGWSSMQTEFARSSVPAHSLDKARELALLFLGATLPEGVDADALDAIVHALNELIGKAPGKAGFADDRLNRAGREAQGLTLSRRRYDKLFRLVGRLEERARRLRVAQEREGLILVGHTGLATRLTRDDFGSDVRSAAFVAYYSARTKLRSEFTIQGQQRPFDETADRLLKLCEAQTDTAWWAIAHVFPRADVLARLSEDEKGRLLAQWFDILQLASERLRQTWERSDIHLETMVVRRGNDSSTWNLLAGAFNRARDHWIALIEAMGASDLLDTIMPGKVLRLVAGDVAGWHRASGGGIHPDTLVWRRLPKPWLVLTGEATCTRADIEAACEAEGIDPVKTGWSAGKSRTAVATYRPTPELVHGVAVNNPHLAAYLRQVGAFSGKALKPAKL